jgi:hypothetical protein
MTRVWKTPALSGVFHLISFLRSKEAMQIALGAACWDLPTPWVWKRPQKEEPPSGLGVWSCLVLSRV